ncbi:MAG: glycosyltransferase [Actinomycetota bacterium]
MISVVIAAGGTGGHLVPALAIAEAVERIDPAARISFVGVGRSLEASLLPGYRTHTTNVKPFRRDLRGVLAPLSLVPATSRARAILREERASVVVGMGGYASVPVVAAARLGGIASVVHEANAVPGLGNEVCALFTSNVAVSFEAAQAAFRRRRPRLIGVPLRRSIATLDRDAARADAVRAFDLDPNARTILVLGGSLGAARVNAAVGDLASRWSSRSDVQLLWSTGAAHATTVTVPSGVLRVRTHPFIERMDLAYAAADVVVARGGASTIAELAAVGLPSVIVPLPIARRKEQHANARALAASGGAVVIEDGDATGERLDDTLGRLFGDRGRLDEMAAGARRVARPHAADEMAEWILALGKGAA